VIMIGAAFVVSSVSHFFHSFKTRKWQEALFQLLSGILYLLVGLILLTRPGEGLLGFTLVLAMLLLMEGVFQTLASFQLPKGSGRGWMLFGGGVTMLLGVLIWARWPASAVWLIGTVIGDNMLLKGWALVSLSLALRSTRTLESQG